MASTYEPIATTTLGSAASSITFSSIPNTYTDLRLVTTQLSGGSPTFTFNSSGGTAYSQTGIKGTGAGAAQTDSYTSMAYILGGAGTSNSATIPTLYALDIFSYTGSTNKAMLLTASNDLNGSGVVENHACLWRNTSAISTITITSSGSNFASGTTATLYGIKAA